MLLALECLPAQATTVPPASYARCASTAGKEPSPKAGRGHSTRASRKRRGGGKATTAVGKLQATGGAKPAAVAPGTRQTARGGKPAAPAAGTRQTARGGKPAAPGAGTRLASGAVAAQAAMGMLGIPYSWGGGGPEGPSYGIGRGRKTKGFDCSGLAEYAWARAGVRIGPTTREQWRSGARVPRAQVRAGDLVFYDSKPKRPGPEHVALAVDGERVVAAPFTGEVVRLDPLKRPDLMGVIRPGTDRERPDTPGTADRPGTAEAGNGGEARSGGQARGHGHARVKGKGGVASGTGRSA